MNIRIYILAALLLFLTCSAQAAGPSLAAGNALYQKGSYEQAAAAYETIAKSGYASTELFYNLGNAYFKANRVPEAILNYERALKLAPEDEDIVFNLRMANLKVVDKIVPVPEIFYKSWINSLAGLFTADRWAVVSVLCFWITLLCAVLFVLSRTPSAKRMFFYLGLLLLCLTLGSYAGASRQQQALESTDAGIVMPESVYVKSSPSERSTDLFILHEGTKVKLTEEIGAWKRIRLTNGNEGWVPAASLAVI